MRSRYRARGILKPCAIAFVVLLSVPALYVVGAGTERTDGPVVGPMHPLLASLTPNNLLHRRLPGAVVTPATHPAAVAPSPVSAGFGGTPMFPVVFAEAGLPPGARWSVTVGGTNATSFNATIEVLLANGTYPYVVTLPLGFESPNGTGNLTVHGTPVDIVATVPGFTGTEGLLPVASTDRLYLTNATGNELEILNASTRTEIGTVGIGSEGWAPILGANGRFLYIVNAGSGTVSVVDDVTDTLAATLRVGDLPYPGALDSANGLLYVPNAGSNNVSVIDSTNHTIVGAFNTSLTPQTVVPVPDRAELFVVADGYVGQYGKLDVVNTTNDSIGRIVDVSSNDVEGGVYVPAVGRVFLADTEHGRSIAVNVSNLSRVKDLPLRGTASPSEPAYDPLTGMIYFPGFDDKRVSILDSVTGDSITSIAVSGNPTMVAFDPALGDIWAPLYSGPGLDLLDGRPQLQPIPVAVIPEVYPVWFNQSGLPTGTAWNLTLGTLSGSSNSTSIELFEPNGSYSFALGVVPGFSSVPSGGAVHVAGAPESVAVVFTRNAIPQQNLPVSFSESGLVSGTSWTVRLAGASNSSTSSTVDFWEPNGSYPFSVDGVPGYSGVPANGTVVVNGSPVIVAISFAASGPANVSLVFEESGLPADGRTWSIDLASADHAAATPAPVTFSVPNGTYLFTVVAVVGYSASPVSGSVTVSGPTTRAIVFSNTTPPASLTVTLTADPSNVTTDTATLLTAHTVGGVSPYRYVYSGLPPGCSAMNASSLSCAPTAAGSFDVVVNVTDAGGEGARANTTVHVALPQEAGAPASSNAFVVPPWGWVALVAGVAVLAIALVVRRRQRGPRAIPPGSPPEP